MRRVSRPDPAAPRPWESPPSRSPSGRPASHRLRSPRRSSTPLRPAPRRPVPPVRARLLLRLGRERNGRREWDERCLGLGHGRRIGDGRFLADAVERVATGVAVRSTQARARDQVGATGRYPADGVRAGLLAVGRDQDAALRGLVLRLRGERVRGLGVRTLQLIVGLLDRRPAAGDRPGREHAGRDLREAARRTDATGSARRPEQIGRASAVRADELAQDGHRQEQRGGRFAELVARTPQ